MSFRGAGGEPLRYRAAVVTGRLVRHRGIATDEFRFVRSLTRRTPKVTLPSPSSQHYLRWRPGVSDRAYPDLDEFFADVAAIYRAELAELATLGATYVQLDDVPLGLLCDPAASRGVRGEGLRSRRHARSLHRAGERGARGPPARAVRRRPRLPGQQPGQVARGGGVRLRGRPRLRPARRRRVLPRVRLAAGRRVRAASPRRARPLGRPRPGVDQDTRARDFRRPPPADRRRRPARARSSGWRSAPSAASRARRPATRCPRPSSGGSSSWWSTWRAASGADVPMRLEHRIDRRPRRV